MKKFPINSKYVIMPILIGTIFTYKKRVIEYWNYNFNYKQPYPIITRREVMDHCTTEKRIWVTYTDSVYDVTDFINVHPGGGEKIMMVAGGSLDPFWEMYAFHKKPEIIDQLSKYKIGILDPKDVLDKQSIPNYDKIKKQTIWRSTHLSTLLNFPFCAECPSEKLFENFYTPKEYFFIRNHNLVPEVDIDDYKLKILDSISGKKLKFSIEELKQKYKKKSVEAIIMCAGNRRSQMNKPEKSKGLPWNTGAIANGIWEGASLRDVLIDLGYSKITSRGLHLIVEGLDKDMQGVYYSISIPLEVAFEDNNDVLLAYLYNGEEIPLEHGYPVRLIIPGYIGVRNVKWVKSLKISDQESTGAFQQKDYKIIPKDIPWENADLSQISPIMKYEVNSAIATPFNDTKIFKKNLNSNDILIKGWAIGNYGTPIKSVEVSLDLGKTWNKVDKINSNIHNDKSFGWTVWEFNLDISRLDEGTINILVRAEDQLGNTQPVNSEDIWNIRGLMNNSYHHIKFTII